MPSTGSPAAVAARNNATSAASLSGLVVVTCGPGSWPYLAGSAAILFALLAGGATTGQGRRLLGFALPEMGDDDLESLASTLNGYSTTAAVLGCAITGLDLDHVETPISFVLAAAAMGVPVQAGCFSCSLGAGAVPGWRVTRM